MNGHLHPLTQFIRLSLKYFTDRGFEITEGPEVETEWYNFDALNMLEDHPARDMQDTFWLKANPFEARRAKGDGDRQVLRTQTTSADVRTIKEKGLKPPLRLIVPGRIFRREATDQIHEHTFYQIDGIVIDEKVNLGNLIALLDGYFKTILGKDTQTRVRPGFFPFVEPGMEMDVWIPNGQQSSGGSQPERKGKLVPRSSKSEGGWREMLGAGMGHPQVLKNMGLDPEKWQAIMWGQGFDRFMMQYFGIDDIRLSYNGDLRFLKQF